jgi:hypothetical protein
MTALNTTLGPAPRRRRAVGLSEAVRWHARRLWQTAESMGRLRAVGELGRVARRLSRVDRELARQLARAAQELASR